MEQKSLPITEWLASFAAGDGEAGERLIALLYRELHAIAAGKMLGERAGHTLSATALVHEAWMRLVGSSMPEFKDRRHFLAVAAIAMRRVLVDHSRNVQRDKRGGNVSMVTFADELIGEAIDPADVLAIDTALTKLAKFDPQMAKIVELRWFGGLSIEETAEHLNTSPRSINRNWTTARAWLIRELEI